MEKNFKIINVCSIDSLEEDWPPVNLHEFNVWLQSKIASIPVKYQKSAMIHFSSTNEYEDSSSTLLNIEYHILESDEDFELRIWREKKKKDLLAEKIKAKELMQLQFLKTKYEEA